MVIFRESKIIIHTKNSFSGIKIQFLLILNSQNLKINCRPICAWCNKHKCGVKCGYLWRCNCGLFSKYRACGLFL